MDEFLPHLALIIGSGGIVVTGIAALIRSVTVDSKLFEFSYFVFAVFTSIVGLMAFSTLTLPFKWIKLYKWFGFLRYWIGTGLYFLYFGLGWISGWGVLASVFAGINIAIGAACLAIAYFKPHLLVPNGSIFKRNQRQANNAGANAGEPVQF